MCVFLMPTLLTFKAFGPRFIEDREENMTHFLCLHHFGGPHYRVTSISNYSYEKMSWTSVY